MSNRELTLTLAYSAGIVLAGVAFIFVCAVGITHLPVWAGVIACIVVALVATWGTMYAAIRLERATRA